MQKPILVAIAAGILTLSACQSTPEKAPAAASTATSISDAAKATLAQAQSDVKDASKAGALWTVTDDALKAALEAEKKGDSAGVIKNAKKASEYAKLGVAQKNYPPIPIR